MGAALLNCPSVQFSILFDLHIRIRTNYSIHAQLGLVTNVLNSQIYRFLKNQSFNISMASLGSESELHDT